MTENPFVPPRPSEPSDQVYPKPRRGENKMPGMLIAICVIALIFSLGGFASSFFSLIGMAIQSVAQNAAPTPSDPTAAKLVNATQGMVLPNVVTNLLNLLVAPMLIAGSIGVLTKQRWGRNFLRWSLIIAAIYVLIKTALQAYIQFSIASAVITEVSAQAKNVPQGMPGTIETIAMVAIVLFSLFSLGLMFAYIFGFFYLGSARIKQYCSTFK